MPFAATRRFARGAYLVEAGAPANAVYLLRRGQARVFVLTPDGREIVTAVLGPGHVAGINALLGRKTYYAYAQAISALEAWVLPAEPLRQSLVGDRDLLGLLVGGLAQRLALEQALLRNAVLLPGAERLRDLQARLPGADSALSATALAAVLGLRPETLSRLKHRDEVPDGAARPAGEPGRGERARFLSGPRDSRRVVQAGASVLPGEPNSIVLIRSGRVRLFLTGRDGRELYVATLETGDMLNLAAFLGQEPLDPRAVAEVTTVVQELHPAELLELLDAEPELLRNVAVRLSGRVEALDQRFTQARAPSTRMLLAGFLHELALTSGGGLAGTWTPVQGTWTHATIGRHIGRTRESVTRALAELEGEGYLRREGRRLLVAVWRVARDFELGSE